MASSRRSDPHATRAAALACLTALAATSASASFPAPQLKLESSLRSPDPSVAAPLGSPVAFGVADLARRVGSVRTELEQARAANAEREEALRRAERYAADLARLTAIQDQTLRGLEALAQARSAALPAGSPDARSRSAARTASAEPSNGAAWPSIVERAAGAGMVAARPDPGTLAAAFGALAVAGAAAFSAVRRRRSASAPDRAGSVPSPVAAGPDVDTVSRQAPVTGAKATAGRPTSPGVPAFDPVVPASEAAPGRAAAAQAPAAAGPARETWREDEALREVDTLIAFEDNDGAARLLGPLVEAAPDNAEYRLRLAHVEDQRGNVESFERQAAILARMMDDALSDTVARVRRAGRGLMPGNPLFDTAVPDAAPSLAGAADAVPDHADDLLDDVFTDASDVHPLQRTVVLPRPAHGGTATG